MCIISGGLVDPGSSVGGSSESERPLLDGVARGSSSGASTRTLRLPLSSTGGGVGTTGGAGRAGASAAVGGAGGAAMGMA